MSCGFNPQRKRGRERERGVRLLASIYFRVEQSLGSSSEIKQLARSHEEIRGMNAGVRSCRGGGDSSSRRGGDGCSIATLTATTTTAAAPPLSPRVRRDRRCGFSSRGGGVRRLSVKRLVLFKFEEELIEWKILEILSLLTHLHSVGWSISSLSFTTESPSVSCRRSEAFFCDVSAGFWRA